LTLRPEGVGTLTFPLIRLEPRFWSGDLKSVSAQPFWRAGAIRLFFIFSIPLAPTLVVGALIGLSAGSLRLLTCRIAGISSLIRLVSLIAGLVFGLGLVISGMTSPGRVIGFLDVTGPWDPSLAFVMGGALLVATPLFALARKREAQQAIHPNPAAAGLIDWRLIGGSALFGIGWGLAGICPGRAVRAADAGRTAAQPRRLTNPGPQASSEQIKFTLNSISRAVLIVQSHGCLASGIKDRT